MDLFFRELKQEDVPSINEISKEIWEGDDYIPHVIERWLREKDCLNYGAFIGPEKSQMVGFGRIKVFPNGIAWLEGGRVKVEFQKQGIGRAMMKYAIDYAYEINAKTAQYDTGSRNLGSISLAKFFGFTEKKRKSLVYCEREKLILKEKIYPKISEINLEEAKQMYKSLDIGPGNEVCIGWSFIPLDYLIDKNSTWIRSSNAILQKIQHEVSPLHEGPEKYEVWFITYGDHSEAADLINFALQGELKNIDIKEFDVFCDPETIELIKDIGFAYWEEEEISVILYEKDLT